MSDTTYTQPVGSDIVLAVTVGGQNIPVTKFSMTGGAYGSVGHITIDTGFSMLQQLKVDLFAMTSGAPGFVEVDVSVTQPKTDQPPWGGYSQQPPQTTTTRIFGGEYVRTDFDLDTDSVQIHARDWAGVLVDQKRILTKIGNAVKGVLVPLAPGRVSAKGISNENQKVGQIVQSIADEFGFNCILNLSNGNPTTGTLYGSADQSFITVPQSLWAILCQVARDTGYVVYVTPTKDLVFGEPGAGLETIKLSFNTTPGDGQLPCKNVRIEHHPRRNSTFRVLVISYDPTLAQSTLGRATYVGAAYAGQHGLTAGMNVGNAAISADKNIVGAGQDGAKVGSTQIPLYTFHVDGLSADQANLRAESIATDIAKRELIMSCHIDGLPHILPTQKIVLSGDMPDAFSGNTFYTSGYQQEFSLPQPGSHHADAGWTTRITCLNVPTEALAKGTEG